MNKSVLIMETPETCCDCQFCYELDEGIEACCSITDNDKDKSLMKEINCEDGYCQGKPNWCPLRLEKRSYGAYYNEGWNDCLEEIIGENNNE
nr:hypothetical protein [uncultured Lachnoclostridium sp.]